MLRLTLNRPDAANSATPAMIDTLLTALAEAAVSDTARVVHIGAAGKAFCSGVDLRRANAPRTEAGKAERERTGHIQRRINAGAHRVLRALSELQLPVVAGVRGWAAGFGLGLALCSDYVVASTTAKFWAPQVGRGFNPDAGATYLLPRLVGIARAKQMVLLSQPIGGEQAAAWGMVAEAVPDGELEDRTRAVVDQFASSATVAVGLAKSLVERNLTADLAQALAAESMTAEVALRSDDFKEGIASLLEKRPPSYRGR